MKRWCTSCGARFTEEVTFCPDDGTETQLLAPTEDGPDPLLSRVIDGRYRIERQIGEGGMGMVYLATHAVLGKRFALKALRGDMAKDPEVVQRFIQEARSATAIGHENIVGISDFGQLPDGSAYFVMELLEGSGLTDLIARGGSIPVQEAVHIIRQIASAVGAAHARGIVHRDLKPDNIFLVRRGDDANFVKVLDFGIAKVGGAASKLTKTGMVFGTPHYMSPEQAAGQTVDQRTDIYALGVIMYEMFTGRVPFDADTFMGILSKHMFEPPVPPSQAGSTARLGALEDVILQCLAKKPEGRYQGMDELLADLDRVRAGGTVEVGRRGGIAPPDNLADSLEPPSRTEMRLSAGELAPGDLPQRRLPLLAIAGVLGVLVVGGGIAAAVLGGDDEEGAAAQPPVVALGLDAGSADGGGADPAVEAEVAVVTIQSEPSGAQVLVGGAIVGNTPVSLPAPEEGQERIVEIRRRGHETETVRLTSDSPTEIAVSLTAEQRQVRQVRQVRTRRARRQRAEPEPTMTAAPMESAMSTMSASSHSTSDVVDPWAE